MPAKNFLKIDQKEKLQKALKENRHPDIRKRILMFLLLNDGKTQAEIANVLGCSLRKVAYWCVHGDPENLESLVDERMKGNYQKVTEEYVKLLLETIEKEPEELGYDFGRWTNARLSTYLEEKTGIKLSSPHSAGYLRQKIILARRRSKKLQNQILFVSKLNRRLNPIDKDKMNRVKTLKNPP